MKRKKIVIFFVAFCSLGAMFLIYDGVEKSRFTEKDLNAEKAASATAKAMSDEIRKIISGIPLASDIVLSDDTEYKEECHYSRISTKNGSKSRFCEKKIIAYAGVSKNNLTQANSYLINNFSFAGLGFDREKAYASSSRDVEKSLSWSGTAARRLEIKYQTKLRNDLEDTRSLEMLNQNDYVLDIYYYTKYSETTKPLNIFEYF